MKVKDVKKYYNALVSAPLTYTKLIEYGYEPLTFLCEYLIDLKNCEDFDENLKRESFKQMVTSIEILLKKISKNKKLK